jgi:hypothetical protein
MANIEVILAGDFNVHSPVWNSCEWYYRVAHHFLEHLIEEYSLVVKNYGTATRHPDRVATEADYISIIDLMLVVALCQCTRYQGGRYLLEINTSQTLIMRLSSGVSRGP